MDCTQALDDFQFEENTQFADGEKKQLGCLEVSGVKHAVYNGENRIGRDVGCSISINSKALSKEHAVIEVIDVENHLIYDLGSRNKTRLGKMVLQPDIRYQLGDGAKLHLADVTAVYRRLPNGPEVDDDSGSETGSESMLNVNSSIDESVIIPETPGPSQTKERRPITVQESPSSASDADGSFVLPMDKFKDKNPVDKIDCEVDIKDKSDNISKAETQSGEPLSSKKQDTIESCSRNSNKNVHCEEKQIKESENKNDIEDIHEADTQCDISMESGSSDIPENKNSTNSAEPEDIDKSKSKSSEENYIFDAPTQCFISDNKTDANEIDIVSSCSEQTEDFTIEENSLSSVEDVNVTKTESEIDLETTVIANEKAEKSHLSASIPGHNQLPPDNRDKSGIKNKKESENRDPPSQNEDLNVSQNEDSFDRSLLEGDDDFFNFETSHVHAKTTSRKTSVRNTELEVGQKSPVRKESNLIPLADKSESKEGPETKDETPSAAELNDSFLKKETEKVTVKITTDSGEETDPEDIFCAPTQPVNNLSSFKEKNEKKSSAEDKEDLGTKADLHCSTKDITLNTKLSKNENFTVPDESSNVNINSTKSSVDSKITKNNEDDIFEAPTQLIETSPVKTGNEIDKNKLTSVCTDDKTDNQQLLKINDEDDIYEAATQMVDVPKIDNLFVKPTGIVKEEEKSVKSKISGNVEQDSDDDISEVCTQQAPVQDKSSLLPQFRAKKDNNLNAAENGANKEKRDRDDNIFEASTQQVPLPNKSPLSSELSVKEAENFQVSLTDKEKVISHTDSDDIYEAATQIIQSPAKNMNSEVVSSEHTDIKVSNVKKLTVLYEDDDFCNAATQKIDDKLGKMSNKDQEDARKCDSNINKITEFSKPFSEVLNDNIDFIDIHTALTQPIASMSGSVSKISEKINEQLISKSELEDKTTRVKDSSTKSSVEENNTTDSSELSFKSADVWSSIPELSETAKERQHKEIDNGKSKRNGHNSEKDKITSAIDDGDKMMVSKRLEKGKNLPKTSNDTKSYVQNEASSKTEIKEQNFTKTVENDSDETDPEELFDEKSSVVEVNNAGKFQIIENSNNKSNRKVEKSSEVGDSRTPSAKLLQDIVDKPNSDIKTKTADVGEDDAEKVEQSLEQIQDPGNTSSEDKEEKSNVSELGKVVSENSSNDTELLREESMFDSPHEKFHDENKLINTQDIVLPSVEDMEKAAQEAEDNETPIEPIEDIPSDDDEGSPVISSKHNVRSKRAKVRKRLYPDSDVSTAELSSGRPKRNVPTETSSDAEDERRSSRRRRQHNESSEDNNILKGGRRTRKQGKLIDKDSKLVEPEEINSSNNTVDEAHCNDTVDISTNDKENSIKSEKSKPLIAHRGRRSRAAASTKEKEKEDKSSRIHRTERASRSKTEKTEETQQNKQTEKSVETQQTSMRGGSTAADSSNVQEKRKRETRHSNRNKDSENVAAANSRPSRQRKMTWKVRESLNDSQGNLLPEEKSKSGSRGSSGSNSQNESNDDMETSSRASRSKNSSPIKSKSKIPETDRNSVGASKTLSLPKSAGQDKVDMKEKKIQNSQVATRTGQKRKMEESSSEMPTKWSRREQQDKPENKVKDTNKEHSTRASRGRDQSHLGNKIEDLKPEQSTRLSNRRSKQLTILSSSSSVATENSKNKTETDLSSRSKRRKMEVDSPSCLKELNTSASSVPSRQQRGQKRTMDSTDKKTEHIPTKQRKREEKNSSSPAKSGVSMEAAQSSRSSRSRDKGTPQKIDAEDTVSVQKTRSGRASKTVSDNKNETEPSTPSIPRTSDKVHITPQHSRATRGKKSVPQNVSNTETRRSTPRKPKVTYQVLFTGFSNAKQESIVKQLGGIVVDLPESGTVLVTDKVRRTYKFLCIMGCGKPIVSPEWLVQSQKSGHFVDPWQYLIKDHESESKFKFRLQESLELAAKTNMLAGYSIHVTSKVKPPPSEMKGIIESCGGTYLQHAPSKNWPANSFIISCPEDKSTWTKLKKSGQPIVGAEVMLSGVLQQKLDLKSNSLV